MSLSDKNLSYINIVKDKAIAWLTLDRPPANAFHYEMYHQLYDAFQILDNDDEVRVIIIKATGKIFSAGNDINEFASGRKERADGIPASEITELSLSSVLRSPKPVISLVNGAACGSGFCLVSYSDIVIASDKARFGIPEIKRGVVGGAPEAAFSLPPKLTRYLALTGELIDAKWALRAGLVSFIVPEEELLNAGKRTAEQILANPPITVSLMKQSLANIYPPNAVAKLISDDEPRYLASMASEDFKEAAAAFLQKRAPDYQGR
ncbi:MAG: enoyl-CoA hydratase/isomerase family protein [Coriobacteriales bacterium]|jgi:enoyl-CoA hydratase|nr:enoyl-CoA hydratase/isomerase family protein [Coriobacteriales bacterium]